MPSLSTHEDASSQFAKREKIAAPLVKAIGTFFAVAGPRSIARMHGLVKDVNSFRGCAVLATVLFPPPLVFLY